MEESLLTTTTEITEEIATANRRDVPPRYQRLYQLAQSGKSRKASITCMCLECQGWSGGVVAAVRDCTAPACPLYAVRPYQKGGEESAELTGEEQTRAYEQEIWEMDMESEEGGES